MGNGMKSDCPSVCQSHFYIIVIATAFVAEVVISRLFISYLACLANLPTGLYILPSVISFFFLFLTGDQLSQDLLDRFS